MTSVGQKRETEKTELFGALTSDGACGVHAPKTKYLTEAPGVLPIGSFIESNRRKIIQEKDNVRFLLYDPVWDPSRRRRDRRVPEEAERGFAGRRRWRRIAAHPRRLPEPQSLREAEKLLPCPDPRDR